MAHITATEPAPVWDYKTLSEFRHVLKQQDPLIISVDFENVDHLPGPGINHYQKMSELGVAVYDTRKRPSSNDRPNPGDNSNGRLESLAKSIVSEHIITKEFQDKTEETCDAFHHRRAHVDPGCAHHARPYHCRFVDSTLLTKAETMGRLAEIIKDLSTQGLTEKEKAAGATRNIKVIVWDSNCEESTFYHGGLNLASLCPTLELWDIQIWYPFRARFHENPNSKNAKTNGETAFSSLGALGTGLPLHNGCNDTVAQLIAFLRFMLMTETEWVTWFENKTDLAPISFDWVNPAIYQRNLAKAPIPEPNAKGKGKAYGYQRGGKNNQHYQASRAPHHTTSWKPTQAKTASSLATRVLANKMSNMHLEQSTPGTPNSSNSSSTGWPEGMDGFSDWSKSPSNSSGHNSSTGWPDDMDIQGQSNDWEDNASNARQDNRGSGWPDSRDNVREHSTSEVTIKNVCPDQPLNDNGSSWKPPKKNKRGRKKKYVEEVEWAL